MQQRRQIRPPRTTPRPWLSAWPPLSPRHVLQALRGKAESIRATELEKTLNKLGDGLTNKQKKVRSCCMDPSIKLWSTWRFCL